MPTESKKHHYVPRSILKTFQDSKDRLFVFDKENLKSFPSNADNAGHENNFNSFQIGDEKVNFEDIFQNIDHEVGQLMQRFKSITTDFDFTPDELHKLAYILLVQQMRTKQHRITISEFSNSINDWINELNSGGGIAGSQIKTLPIVDDNNSRFFSLLGLDKIEEIVEVLLSKGIVLFRTTPDYPFWISDNPVVMDNALPYGQLALKSPGTDLYFPVTKELLVGFMCSITCNSIRERYLRLIAFNEPIPEDCKQIFDGVINQKVIEINHDHVDYFNHLQVRESSRFIYSNIDEFSLAKDMIQEAPSLKEIKGRVGIMRESREYTHMPVGEHVVFFFEESHFMIPVQLEFSKYDLIFHSPNQSLYLLFMAKKRISWIEVFRDKRQIKLMREVVISEYDPSTGRTVLKHWDQGLQGILEDIKKRV